MFHDFRKDTEKMICLGPQLGKFKERWFDIWGIDSSLGMSDGWCWLFEETLTGAVIQTTCIVGSVCGISMGARLDFLIAWWQQKERTFYKQTNTQPEWTWMTYLWPNLEIRKITMYYGLMYSADRWTHKFQERFIERGLRPHHWMSGNKKNM